MNPHQDPGLEGHLHLMCSRVLDSRHFHLNLDYRHFHLRCLHSDLKMSD